MQAMPLEATVRTDPVQRAERFVEDWQQLKSDRDELRQGGDTQSANKIARRMSELAKGLDRDPQLELHLHGKAKELGIELQAERNVASELSASLGIGRSRSFDMSV